MRRETTVQFCLPKGEIKKYLGRELLKKLPKFDNIRSITIGNDDEFLNLLMENNKLIDGQRMIRLIRAQPERRVFVGSQI